MPRPLVFLMGRSPAILPVDRQYTRSHLWAQAVEGAGGHRFGLSAYAVRLLGDVKHLAWSMEAGQEVAAGQTIGYIEASKAASDLFAPASGRIEELNPRVLADPSLLNSDLYGIGWLFRLSGAVALLTPQQYLVHVEASWPLAQRLLKGQAGRPPA